MKEKYIDYNGYRIWTGTHNESSNGPRVLVLNGGPGCSHHYLKKLAEFFPNNPVTFYDQLGSGLSKNYKKTVNSFTVKEYTAEFNHILKQFPSENLIVIGHSWGTTLLASYIVEYGNVGIANIHLSPIFSYEQYQADLIMRTKEISEECYKTLVTNDEDIISSEKFKKLHLEYNKKFMCSIYPWPKDIQDTLDHFSGQFQDKAIYGKNEFLMTGPMCHIELTDSLRKKLSVPTLLISGSRDFATPRAAKNYQNQIGEFVTTKIIDNATHCMYLDKPKKTQGAILSFIKSLRNSPQA